MGWNIVSHDHLEDSVAGEIRGFFVLLFTVNFIILKIAHFSEFPFLDGLECAT